MAVDPAATLISSESLQAAELISNVAYGSTGFAADANLTQDLATLTATGWTQMAAPTDTNNSYAGVAFYKIIMINGVNTLQVVIGNRGTDSVHDIAFSDFAIASVLNSPASDQQAKSYYDQIIVLAKNIAQKNGNIGISVLEAGHSLGGQEADFVATQPSTSGVPTAAITFDAPGQSISDALTATSKDAFNIYSQGDLVHLAGGPYVGGSAEIDAEVVSDVWATVNHAEVDIKGFHLYVAGAAGLAVAGLYQNHSLTDINAYLAAHPALGGINFDLYPPDQLTQHIVDELAAVTPDYFYKMTAAEKASFYANIFNATSTTGTSTSSSGSTGTSNPAETYTAAATSADGQTLTGSMGDKITQTVSGSTAMSSDSNGDSITQSYDATTGALTSDTWKNAIGTKGADTYATDGSSKGTVTYADGNYATTLDDGQGNITTDYYTKDGIEIRSTWVHSDGSSGAVNLFADGTTLIPGGGTYDVPASSSTIVQNPDGSYVTTDWNANDAGLTTNFAANGSQTSQSTGTGTGVNDLTVASSKTGYVAGEEVTTNYNASGAVVGDSWYAANPDGSVNPNGVYVAWAQATASSGTTVDNESGVIVKSATALDGSLYRDTTEPQGDTVSHLTASGTLLSDNWTITDGSSTTPSVTGSDTFNADGSGKGTFSDTRDGTAGTVTLNGQGDIVVVNTNASGTVTSEDTWNGSTDSYTVATLNGSGTTLSSYDYLANGNVIATDYAPDGTTVADQQTVAAGLVINPDGSSFSKVMNADGSYTVYYLNASGDTTAYQYSTSGQLTGSYHTSNYDWPRSGWSGTFAGGSAAGTPWTSLHNDFTPVYTDAQGTTWTEYWNASGSVTGEDYVNGAKGTHGYVTFGANGASYEVDYAADGSSTVINEDGKGDVTNTLFDAAGDETGDNWKLADGSHGGDTYNADGSSSGSSFNADGTSSAYTNDGKGDVVTADFSAAGVKLSQAWTNADGTSGNETFNANGSTVTTSYNADGSYYVTDNDGKGDIFQTDYSAAGVKTGDAWQKSDGTTGSDSFFALGTAYNLLAEGQTTYPDGSSSQYQTILDSNNLVETDTTFLTSGGAVSGTRVSVDNGNGTLTVNNYSASGALTETMTETLNSTGSVASDTWVKPDGSSGTDTFNADGSSSGTAINTDGSTTAYANDGKGNITTDNYKASGVLSAVAWSSSDPYVTTTSTTQANGSVTTTSSNSQDHSSIVTTTNADGSSVKTLADGKGDTTTDNYSASNILTSDSWTKADGTSGSDVYNADGSFSSTVNDGKGDVTTDDYNTAGTLTQVTQITANGTKAVTSYNSDGSYVTVTTDAAGDTTTDTYSATGTLLSSTTTSAGDYTKVTTDPSTGQTTTSTYSSAGVLLSDTWTNTNGSSGSDTFNTDGSSSGKATNADGSTSSYTNDGKSDVTTDDYNTAGTLTQVTQITANGTKAVTSYNSDGSYVTVTTDAAGDTTTDTYSATGTLLSSTTTSAGDYTKVTTDPSTGQTTTSTYSSAGVLLSDTWTNTNGSSGSDTFNTDGSSSGKATNADGSTSSYTNDGKGDVTTDDYSAIGTLTQVTQTTASGTKTVTSYNADGSYVTTATDTAGDMTTDTYTATGVITSDVWKAASGASGVETNTSTGALSKLTWSNLGGISGSASYDAGTGSYDILATGPSGATYTESIQFSQSGTDLVATIAGGGGTLTAQGWGQATDQTSFIGTDGQLLGGINVEQLVQAMAGFTPPTSVQSSYMTQEAAALSPIIAASWQ